MLSCHDMKKGDIFTCKDCGLELQVIKECDETETSADECCCSPQANPCTFSCCGKELLRKKAK